MPSAISGEEITNGYYYAVNSSPDDIQQFYEIALAKLGWNLFATGQGETEARMLFFMKDAETLTISIFPKSDGLIYVMII